MTYTTISLSELSGSNFQDLLTLPMELVPTFSTLTLDTFSTLTFSTLTTLEMGQIRVPPVHFHLIQTPSEIPGKSGTMDEGIQIRLIEVHV